MIYSVTLSIIVLIVICVWIHSLVLIKSRELNLHFSVLALLISHVIHVSLFALLYLIYINQYGFELGFVDVEDYSFMNIFYFSSSIYTTLGIGDIYPKSTIKLIASIQSILGLVMIALTASAIFLKLKNHTNKEK